MIIGQNNYIENPYVKFENLTHILKDNCFYFTTST
ncbi:hypothetical protein BPC006_II0938 [Burkholderia pseudomallei BPC006]|nr:hypothetical protein BPC006_II0938 [Burkholderia pseudomallei BPC006]